MDKPSLPDELPPLSDNLSVEKGGVDFNGQPTWIIQNLTNNHFFHIGWQEHEILAKWRRCKTKDFLNELLVDSLANINEEYLINFIVFLSENCLIEQPFTVLQQKNNDLIKKKKSTHWFIVLAKTYLFFRIPLVKPNQWLTNAYPYFSWLFKRNFFLFIIALFGLTLLFLTRSWTSYSTTFFEIQGIQFFIFYFLALGIAKIMHELGHAFACKHHQLNVASMGVAFLVMFPMLYTDTSESWKIKCPKARIIVPLAGVWVEFCLAIIAFWFWFFLPEGPLKSVCFFLSSYSLLTTLIINISPFLRFDGYHVLSDLLSMRNLQTRAFALCNWWVREKIFHFNIKPPEYFTQRKMNFLLFYSLCTWLYRFVLFMGIALLVYYLFFKVLGIILFVIEIIYFILIPIFSEIRIWWKMRDKINLNKHTMLSSCLFLMMIGFFFLPWKNTVSIPATLAIKTKTIFSRDAVYVKKVLIKEGDKVKKNQLLAIFSSPLLTHHLQQNQLQLNKLKWQLRNMATFQGKLFEASLLKAHIKKRSMQRVFLLKKKKELLLTSPIEGTVNHLAKTLAKDSWISKEQALLILVSSQQINIEALANFDDASLIRKNQNGFFIPEPLSQKKIPLTVSNVSNGSITELGVNTHTHSHAYLGNLASYDMYHSSALGGEINVRPNQASAFDPEENLYKILFSVNSLPKRLALPHVVRGQAKIHVNHYSIAGRFLRKIMAIILRELSF